MRELLPADPREVGPYRLLARLGAGGMGEVFLGRSPGGRTVAVKVVRQELAEDVQFRLRFKREVEAARRVGGFYTAQVVDADTEAVPPWLVTSYIPGPSLREAVVECGPFSSEALAALGAGLAEGLKAIHECGVVHRDLKPGNVILADDGPRVIDFGIARALDATSQLTRTGAIGTPAYMSPEQIRGQEAGPASDVFCLAAVLAYAATGKGPFGDGPTEAVIYRVVHDEPDLSRIPADLAPLVAAGLAKAPDERPGITEFLGRCAALAGPDGLRLPDGVTELIKERTARTKALTARSVPPPPMRLPMSPEEPPAPVRIVQQVRATGQKTALGYTPVALPWLPGKTAGARRARIVRWHKQVGDDVAVDEPLIDVSSVRGDTVITSPANGTLLAVYRNNGTSARIGSVVAGIGTPGAKVPRVRRIRTDRLALLGLGCALAVTLVVGLVGAQSSLFMGGIDAAREGDCVAQEYPEGNRNADWFTQPCVFMELRAFLSDSSEDKYYSKVLYRDPPVKCSESAKGWSESDDHEAEVGDMVLCLEPL
ncbi:protein kinase [Streptomyces atratus]|uniref:serine/threonine-protein kinase n=1 Tax=Streptomyces atratus TaxID=1893 RepID=UPI00166F7C40|nr:serine/threonine-protein kinase [Streptomyces atratus]WPW31618.1 protein kinase [Streptomyces atratus]